MSVCVCVYTQLRIAYITSIKYACGQKLPSILNNVSRARTLEAGKRWSRLAQARAASRPGLCAIAPGRSAGYHNQ